MDQSVIVLVQTLANGSQSDAIKEEKETCQKSTNEGDAGGNRITNDIGNNFVDHEFFSFR